MRRENIAWHSEVEAIGILRILLLGSNVTYSRLKEVFKWQRNNNSVQIIAIIYFPPKLFGESLFCLQRNILHQNFVSGHILPRIFILSRKCFHQVAWPKSTLHNKISTPGILQYAEKVDVLLFWKYFFADNKSSVVWGEQVSGVVLNILCLTYFTGATQHAARWSIYIKNTHSLLYLP